MDNKVRFTVEFNNEVWSTLDAYQRTEWLRKVEELLSQEVLITHTETSNFGIGFNTARTLRITNNAAYVVPAPTGDNGRIDHEYSLDD